MTTNKNKDENEAHAMEETNYDTGKNRSVIWGEKPEDVTKEEGMRRKKMEYTPGQENPFKPKTSLSMGPTKSIQNCMEPRTKIVDEVFHSKYRTKRKKTEEDGEWFTLKIGDKVMVERAIFAKMEKEVGDIKAVVNAIYEYAVTTKNAKSLLKEKSAVALKHLGSLGQDVENAIKGKRVRTEDPNAGNEGPRVKGRTIINIEDETEIENTKETKYTKLPDLPEG